MVLGGPSMVPLACRQPLLRKELLLGIVQETYMEMSLQMQMSHILQKKLGQAILMVALAKKDGLEFSSMEAGRSPLVLTAAAWVAANAVQKPTPA